MNGVPPGAPAWVNLIPLVMIGAVILRNSRARKGRPERLWILPLIIIALTALPFAQSPAPGPVGLTMDAAALGIGALLGWWRARASTFTIDPQTHQSTS